MKKLSILLIILILGSALYFFMGFYNVSATKPHMKITETLLHIVAERSIKRNSANLKNPYDINDQSLYVKGFEEYDEMCFQCHGWKGLEISNSAKGLNPAPPRFPEDELYEYSLEEIFWITKTGIKMTGMPAYGPTHDDKTIWSIAIFLDGSRDMGEKEYKKLRDKYSEEPQKYHHGD